MNSCFALLRLCGKLSKLGGLAEDQSIKVGIVTQGIQVVIVLSTHAQVRLKI